MCRGHVSRRTERGSKISTGGTPWGGGLVRGKKWVFIHAIGLLRAERSNNIVFCLAGSRRAPTTSSNESESFKALVPAVFSNNGWRAAWSQPHTQTDVSFLCSLAHEGMTYYRMHSTTLRASRAVWTEHAQTIIITSSHEERRSFQRGSMKQLSQPHRDAASFGTYKNGHI